jgi:hypothetical protein
MKVKNLIEGMMMRARPGMYVYGAPHSEFLQISKFMAWWDDWQPAENEILVYLGDRSDTQIIKTHGMPTTSKKVLVREVLWRGRVWRVMPGFWRHIEPSVDGEGAAKGCDEPSMSIMITDQYHQDHDHV